MRKSETPGPTRLSSCPQYPSELQVMRTGASETWRWSLSFLMAPYQESIEDKDSKQQTSEKKGNGRLGW